MPAVLKNTSFMDLEVTLQGPAAVASQANKAESPSLSLAGRRIAIMPRGSRGDVQPFVALGARLLARGCRVLVLTNSDHVDFVAKFGMEAVGVAPDCQKKHASPEFQHALETGDWRSCAEKDKQTEATELPQQLMQEYTSLREFAPDLIYATPLVRIRSWLFSQMLGVPMVLGSLQPIEEQMPRPMEEAAWAVQWRMYQAELAAIRALMNGELKDAYLDPARTSYWAYRQEMAQPPHPVLVHWSPALNEVPAKKQQRHRLTGFLVVARPEQEERFRSCDSTFGGEKLQELQRFLGEGEAPVYMGWGSMVIVSPEHMACLAVRALKRAGLRGVVLGGWAGLAAGMLQGQPDSAELVEYARLQVLFVQSAPHEWLFPRCLATVHHGGAGTTAAALRAGVPTVITPCGLDQPGIARRVQASGCGLALQHFPQVTPEALAAALSQCAADQQMQARCRVMGELLGDEDGVRNTVEELEHFLREEVSTGVWHVQLEEQHEQALSALGRWGDWARQQWAAKQGHL